MTTYGGARTFLHTGLLLAAMAAGGCSGSPGKFSLSGQVGQVRQSALSLATAAPLHAARTVSHVMAVNPESANLERSVAPVDASGRFSLDLVPGKPYVLVFIDSSAVGADMVVAIFKDANLDTIAPQNAGHADLGMVDTSGATARPSIAYDTLIAQLGLSPAGAEFLGSVDDMSLRYANPDIDADGVIDAQQPGHEFQIDFHLRSNMRKGPAGPLLTMADITDRFFAEGGEEVATPDFNLASIYALYPAAFDATEYVSGMDGPGQGARFTATQADGSTPSAPTSYSPLHFGDRAGWGPDYSWERGVELPGSSGSPATLSYLLGASGKTLTFTNVLTRRRASLTDTGTLLPFVRVNTADGMITSLDYRWMKRVSAAAWTPATAEEIDLVVNDGGGYAAFYRRAKSAAISFRIPRTPSGNIRWTRSAAAQADPSDDELAHTSPADVCSTAFSYDDKLGLRLFAGGVAPMDGVTPCY
jgi:hypothetical protein